MILEAERYRLTLASRYLLVRIYDHVTVEPEFLGIH